ncbi:hypothetical protein NC651_038046 [Populus alba x Populus x berolinensis]|nr:hypothetical protein NC651_038046 [Populus alba x Populus x berolinensis]
MPTFSVQITNTNTKVQVSKTNFKCGQFNSTIITGHKVFKCIPINNCLINNINQLLIT